jgi:omega-6 fatty acid desaturase (delta-12 desaturase)
MSKVTKPVKDDLSFSLADIRKAIPVELFVKDELRFLVSVGYSVSFTLILMYLSKEFVPFTWILLPFWVIYALITGCIATGVWVLGHECGHGSFSNNQILNDTLGYILHTILLVPYFSW